MKKWKIAVPVLAIALFAAWYAFRPERLVVNRRVNEGFATAEGASRGNLRVENLLWGNASYYRFRNHLPPCGRRSHSSLHELQNTKRPDVHVYLVAAADAQDFSERHLQSFARICCEERRLSAPNWKRRPGSRQGSIYLKKLL